MDEIGGKKKEMLMDDGINDRIVVRRRRNGRIYIRVIILSFILSMPDIIRHLCFYLYLTFDPPDPVVDTKDLTQAIFN